MLTKFEVKNYAGFEKTITFDLTSKRKIDYNKSFVEKGIIKKALIYGPNGSGKSSLCMAIMDITYHLVDKEKMNIPNYKYFYCGCDQEIAEFTYWFKFDGKIVKYSYTKYAPTLLGFESLYINNEYMGFYVLLDAFKLSWVEFEYDDIDSTSLYQCKSRNNFE